MRTQFEHAYVLNVMSDDHPGIVSAVSHAVALLGGNIDTASQTVVGGYFTLIMVVSLPERLEPDDLARRVSGVEGRSGGLQVVARPYLTHVAERAPAGVERFVVTAFGRDKPGIIAHFSGYLAGKDINITDFYWNVTDGQFVMISEVEIPRHMDFNLLQADVEEIGREEAFTVKLQHVNVFVATNQLRLPHLPHERT